MFCPSNETLQNLTEKTKLLAQKCSQQIRVASATYGSEQPEPDPAAPAMAGAGGAGSLPPPPPSPVKEGTKSLRCLCPCKGTISKMIAKKVGLVVTGKDHQHATLPRAGTSNTRWYVKVIQMAYWHNVDRFYGTLFALICLICCAVGWELLRDGAKARCESALRSPYIYLH